MTIYIFEDHEKDGLSNLFRQPYDSSVSDHFVYAGGAGNLESLFNEYLSKSEVDFIAIFMDVVPGNLETRRIYNTLRRIAHKTEKRTVIIPILCAEYCFLKAFAAYSIVTNQEAVDYCISLRGFDYKNIITTSQDIRYCTSFERYCKLVQVKALCLCANTHGVFGRSFYYFDCEHGDCEKLYDKGLQFLSGYPCVPKLNADSKSIDLDEVLDSCVMLHNSLCDTLKLVDPLNASKYKYITK